MKVRVERIIPAPPEELFDRLADLAAMSELSPECVRVEWLDRDGSQVGDRFRGWNQSGPFRWWTNGWVRVLDRPRLLVVETSTIYGDRDEPTNRWTYELHPDAGGTRVIERLETLRLPIHLRALGPFLALRWVQVRAGMNRTLANLQHEVEVRPRVAADAGQHRSARLEEAATAAEKSAAVSLPAAVVIAGAAGLCGFALDSAARRLGWSYPSLGSSAALLAWGTATLGLVRYGVRRYDSDKPWVTAIGLTGGRQRSELWRRTPVALFGLAGAGALSIVMDRLPFGQALVGAEAFGDAQKVGAGVLLTELLVRYPTTVFAEEALFRGWLQPRMPAGVLVSALLWAGFHLQQIPTIPALIPFGIALGTIRWWSGNIRATLAVHYLGNAVFLLTTHA